MQTGRLCFVWLQTIWSTLTSGTVSGLSLNHYTETDLWAKLTLEIASAPFFGDGLNLIVRNTRAAYKKARGPDHALSTTHAASMPRVFPLVTGTS